MMETTKLPLHVGLTSVLTAALLLLLLQAVSCQKLPARKEDALDFIQRPELFYDTGRLPDGREVTTYLYKNMYQIFNVLVFEDHTPLTITVTPCASTLTWSVTYKKDLEKLEVNDRRSSEGIWEEQKRLLRKLKKKSKSKNKNLETYTGKSVHTFHLPSAAKGGYLINVTALDFDTSVKLYATTTPFSDNAYPALPQDSNVYVTLVKKSGIVVQWKPSPSDTREIKNISYCLSVNKKENYLSQCAVLASKYGDSKPALPKDTGFGFTSEELERSKKGRHPITPQPNDIGYFCVGSKTQYKFSHLQYGDQYYFDVFAVEVGTNKSVRYNGTSVTYPYKRRDISLREGKVLESITKPSNIGKLYRFSLDKEVQELKFTLQMCYGDMRIVVYKGGRIIKRARVRNFKDIVLRSPEQGLYYIRVIGTRRRSRSFRISVSTRSSTYQYPVLPEDTSISVFDKLRTCHSVTLAWFGTLGRSRYCVYKTLVDRSWSRTVLPPVRTTNKCNAAPDRRKSSKVLCRYFKSKNKRKSLVVQTVRDLLPNSTYLIQVYVTKPRGQTLSYKNVLASTESRC